jgi:tetratricopeptide (TPR) repeat protein
MACDFCLTDPWTREAKPYFAHKLITVNTAPLSALVGVTGIALLDGKPIGDWLAEAAAGLEPGAVAEYLLEALRRAEASLSKLRGANDKRLTFVVGAMIGSQSLVALVSNFEKLVNGRIKRSSAAESVMTITRVEPQSELFFAIGDAATIKAEEYGQLLLSLRSGTADERIHEQMKSLNEAVSTRTKRVSPGCCVASLHAKGAGSSQPSRTEEQKGDFIPPESALMMKRAGIKVQPRLGSDNRLMPVRMDQGASARAGPSFEYFHEQLRRGPDSAEAWNNYGSFLISRRRWDEAIMAYEKAIVLDPSYLAALANLAKQAWLHLKDVPRADRLYGGAVAAGGTSVPSWVLSDFAVFCHEALGDSGRAAELHDRAARDRNYPLAAARQAWFVFRSQKDLRRAEELSAHALSKEPGNVQILCLAGQIDLHGLKDLKAAREKFRKACSLNPNDVNALRLAADTSLASGDSASAAYYYRRLIKRVEYDAEIHSNYGLALLMERKSDGALRHLSKAARSAPSNVNIRANLAATLWARGKRDEAVTLMRTIMDDSPSPQTELAVNAMLRLAVPSSARDPASRIRQLIADGVQTYGTTVRGMVLERSRREREAGDQLAKIIEGKMAVPSDW